MKWDYKLYEWVNLLIENSSEIKDDVKYMVWLSWGLTDAKVIANMWTSRHSIFGDEGVGRHEWVEFKYPLEFRDEDFDLENFDPSDNFYEENYTSQYHEPHNCGLVSRFQKGGAWHEKLKSLSNMTKNPHHLPYPPYPVEPYSRKLVVSQSGFAFRWEYELAEKYAEAVHVDVEWNEYDDELDDGYGRKEDTYNKKYNLSVNQFYLELQKNDGCCHLCDEPFKILNFHPNREIHVDHDHNRKDPHYRGLLCVGCNTRTMSEKTMKHYESGAVHRYQNSYYERCGYRQKNLVYIGVSPEEASSRAFGLTDEKK
jgi:hypothetical protein